MIEQYITIAINSIFVGIGVATGTFLGNKLLVRHIEKMEKRMIKNAKLFKKTGK